MKQFFILCIGIGLYFFCGIGLYAQSKDATALLKRVSSNYERLEAFEVNFSYEIEVTAADVLEKIEGKAVIQKDNYILDLDVVKIYCDGISMWTYQQEINEVTITKPTVGDELSFENLFKLYGDDYKARILPLTPDKAWKTIELAPKDVSKEIFKIQIRVNSSSETIERLRLFYKDGTRYTYTLTLYKPIPSQNKSAFAFPKAQYPSASIIDLR